jgi:starch synthase
MKSMKIAFLSSEISPLAKTGGLADVAAALPPALRRRGHEVVLFMPLYRCVRKAGWKILDTGLHYTLSITGKLVDCAIKKTILPDGNLPIYLIECDPYFDREGLYQDRGHDWPDNLERFTLYNRAVLRALQDLPFRPDILHTNDWQTALLPIYLRTTYQTDTFFAGTSTVFTIHNLAYQGVFNHEQFPITGLPWSLYSIDGLEFYGKVNLLKGALLLADRLTTVSRQYAREIQTDEFGCGLHGVLRKREAALTGILNGVDYSVWNPETDPKIAANYSAEDLSGKAICKKDLQKAFKLPQRKNVPVLGAISRLADQKGFDLLAELFDYLMGFDVQFVLLGSGAPEYHQLFEEMAGRFPKKCGIALRYDDELAHKIEAGSDLFLMPSRYEPCGLNQMYSLRYGTIPVVRATGGLADTVQEFDPEKGQGNGFVFQQTDPKEFFWAVMRALETWPKKAEWKELQQRAMRQDFSWDSAAAQYLSLYRSMRSRTGKSVV